MVRVQSLIVAAALFALASCAVSPVSGQPIYTSEAVFEGFVDVPGVKVRLEAFDYGPDKYTSGVIVRAATTPSFAAGAICPNSPALYRYKGTIDLKWPFYWDWVAPGQYEAKVRAFKVTTSGETPLFFTTDPNAGQCMEDNAFNSTCDFSNAAVTCGFKINEAVIKGVGGAPWNN